MNDSKALTSYDPLYEAMRARDARFDGKFFVAVKTTGIYCRPICPARPKRRNVEFFRTAHAAEDAGYRPCLRCRPESAPGSPAWNGTRATVQRALKLIAQGALVLRIAALPATLWFVVAALTAALTCFAWVRALERRRLEEAYPTKSGRV